MGSNDWGRDYSAHGGNGEGREVARVQIFKQVTKERLLDISDMLNLEPRRNKIAFTLVEFDENFRAKTRVRHYADVPDFKLVCWDILHGTFTEWTDHKGTQVEDGLQARVMTVRKDPKYRQPYVIKIDNGVGEALPGGAVKMVRATESLTLLLPEWEARRMAQTVLDYIRDWETVNFRKRQEAQTVVVTLPNAGYEPPMTSSDHGQDENGETEESAEIEDVQPQPARRGRTGRAVAAAASA